MCSCLGVMENRGEERGEKAWEEEKSPAEPQDFSEGLLVWAMPATNRLRRSNFWGHRRRIVSSMKHEMEENNARENGI